MQKLVSQNEGSKNGEKNYGEVKMENEEVDQKECESKEDRVERKVENPEESREAISELVEELLESREVQECIRLSSLSKSKEKRTEKFDSCMQIEYTENIDKCVSV